MPCRVTRGGDNPIEDRLNKFNSGLQIDSEETLFFTRTSPLHDPRQGMRDGQASCWSQYEHRRRRNVLTGYNLKCKMQAHKGITLT
jgi:hypothetical protein